MTDQVLTCVEGGSEGAIGRIRLNRPAAIHALTRDMCEAMIAALLAWRKDERIVAVMIDHAEGRGFCSGGDVAMLAKSAKGDCSEAEAFFRTEYRLNHLLFVYEKPVVALLDGIVMGGGVGIADPAKFRIATERTTYAIPETAIGLFPDVGGGWSLPRLPGRTGAWLATTGARIDGADCAAIGMATHYLASHKLAAVKARIIADPYGLEEILDEMADVPPASRWEGERADIDRLFASDRYEDILTALRADGSSWATSQLASLATKSPQAIKVALRQMAEGAEFKDFAANMRNEYRVACHVIRRPDFVEGVRAVMLDKDGEPRWTPACPEDATDALIDSLFAPLAPEKEWTPLPGLRD
ncbi:MAG TPA: enoyl-CoA hydratase/isomerase family protein [Sphingobium sp.]|nr:enoyl-CoA hydratase/isomerase family protein [Sphingobium sp.]